MVPRILFTSAGDIHDSAVKCVPVSRRRAGWVLKLPWGQWGSLREEEAVREWQKGRKDKAMYKLKGKREE